MPAQHWRFPTIVSGMLAALVACGSTSPGPPDHPLRMLLIGNSLTAANDLPGMIQRLGQGIDGRTPTIQSVTFGNFSLEDHWNRGDAQEAIAGGPWDIVVLQQGPSALPDSRVLLVEYATKFAAEIRRAGARPAMYMVWPESSRATVWDEVTQSYVEAARAIDGLLFPAGEAFRSVVRPTPGLEVLSSDGFHPTPEGTYLAALVIYAQAVGRSPVGMSGIAHIVDFPLAEINALEAAAANAIRLFATP